MTDCRKNFATLSKFSSDDALLWTYNIEGQGHNENYWVLLNKVFLKMDLHIMSLMQ